MAAVACFTPTSHARDHVSVLKRGEGFRANKRGRVKSVTWAARDQICQVRLFLSDDCPSILGPLEQEFTQSSNGPSKAVPGYKDIYQMSPATHFKRARIESMSNMCVQMAWTLPPKFLVDPSLFVVSGEESFESAVQQKRELSVLEAFYPRLTSIPECPLECNECSENDGDIPEVPLTLCDDECGIGVSSATCEANGVVLGGESDGGKGICKSAPGGAEEVSQQNISGDIATAVCMAIDKLGAKDLVDQKLLFEILRNPSLITSLSSSCKDGSSMATTSCHGNVDRPSLHTNVDRCANVDDGSSMAVRHTPSHHVENVYHVLHPGSSSSPSPSPSPSLSAQMLPPLPGLPPSSSSSWMGASALHVNGGGMESSQLLLHSLPVMVNGGNYHENFRGFSDSAANTDHCFNAQHNLMIPPAYCRDGLPEAVNCAHPCEDGPGLMQAGRECEWQQSHLAPYPNQSEGTPIAQTCRDAARQGSGANVRGCNGIVSRGFLGIPPMRKPCIYFNTPRGCRKGEKCIYRH